MIRRLLFVAGVIAAIGGLVLIAAPGIAGSVTVSDILVYLLGAIALLLALARIQRRRKAERRETSLDEPETPVSLPTPGSDVDIRIRNLRRLRSTSRVASERQDLDSRLEELAVRVLARRHDSTREEARQQLADGSWTTDDLAAAYFTDSIELPMRERMRLSIQVGAPTGIYAARAVEALAGRVPGGEEDD